MLTKHWSKVLNLKNFSYFPFFNSIILFQNSTGSNYQDENSLQDIDIESFSIEKDDSSIIISDRIKSPDLESEADVNEILMIGFDDTIERRSIKELIQENAIVSNSFYIL